MSAAAAVPAAVRPHRTGAARRAVLTLLFLGVFLTLAVIFGGSASAASNGGHDAHTSGGSASGLVESGGSSKTSGSSRDKSPDEAGQPLDAAADAKPSPGDSLGRGGLAKEQQAEARRAAERTASPVTEEFAGGAEDAGQLTRSVGEAVRGVAGSAELSELPGRLGLDGPGGGHGGDSGDSGGRGGEDGENPSGGTDRATSHGHTGGKSPHPDGNTGTGAALSHAAVHATGGAGGDGAPGGSAPHQHTPAVPAPAASQYAGDSQGQRGGPNDLSAVVDGAEHAVQLQYGAARAAHGTPTRELAGDILEFPG